MNEESNFTRGELNLMACVGGCEAVNKNIVRITRGTLCVRVCKVSEGNYSVYCTDETQSIQAECSDECLESAIKLAFQKYRDESSIVRQTRQFISNAEDDIRKYMETAK